MHAPLARYSTESNEALPTMICASESRGDSGSTLPQSDFLLEAGHLSLGAKLICRPASDPQKHEVVFAGLGAGLFTLGQRVGESQLRRPVAGLQLHCPSERLPRFAIVLLPQCDQPQRQMGKAGVGVHRDRMLCRLARI